MIDGEQQQNVATKVEEATLNDNENVAIDGEATSNVNENDTENCERFGLDLACCQFQVPELGLLEERWNISGNNRQ